MPTENQIDCPALHERSSSYPFGDRVPRTVRMLKTVTPDPMPGIGLSYIKGEAPVAQVGQTYHVWTNSHGAVSAVMDDGTRLGLRPAEFEVDSWHQLATEPAEQRSGEPTSPVITVEQVLGAYQFASFGPAKLLRGTTNWCSAFAQELNHRIGADTSEVERIAKELREVREERDEMRRSVDEFQSRSHGIKNLSVIEQLNDKLAERDVLLREWLENEDEAKDWVEFGRRVTAALSASADPSAPIVSIPDEYCLMPRSLTAENGAKALLLGEFKLEVTQECPECRELDEPAEGCEICDGEGEYGQRHVIPWDKLKFIYSVAVKGLALKSQGKP